MLPWVCGYGYFMYFFFVDGAIGALLLGGAAVAAVGALAMFVKRK